MLSWRALLNGAQPLTVVRTDDGFVERAVASLSGVKLDLRPRPAFRYPKANQLGSIRAALTDLAAASPAEACILAQLLRRPLRTYALGGSEAAFALVGSWRLDDEIEPRVAVLRGEPASLTLDLEAYGMGQTLEDLVAAMEALYLDLDPRVRNVPDKTGGPTDRVLWLGGSDSEVGSHSWRSELEAVLMVEGFSTVVRERPGKDSVAAAKAVSELGGVAVVVWLPRLGNPDLAATVQQVCGSLRVIELSEYAFADALEELRLILADDPLPAGGPADDQVDEDPQFESGITYYFKKVAKRGPGVDRVIQRRDPCAHNSWTIATKAPQARKGIERHANRGVRKLEHCDRCTGGGMWRVTFD